MSHSYTPWDDLQRRAATLETVGPQTGHAVYPIAFCASEQVAEELFHRVNTYDALVEALEAARKSLATAVIAGAPDFFTQDDVGEHRGVGMIDAALALAKGE